jgi:hypothetical protein
MRNRVMRPLAALSENKENLLPLLVLLLLSTVFFAKVLFTNQVLVSDNLCDYYPWRYQCDEEAQDSPSNGIWDRVLEEYPQRVIAAGIVRGGQLPLWNPYVLSGLPMLATDPGRGFLYPFNLVFYLLDPLKALGYASFLQLLLAAVFAYLYLRAIELRRSASLLGAIAFGLGGYFLPYLSWLDRVDTGIWMPLMFLCVEKLFRGKRWIWSIVLGLAIGMAGLAGHFGVLAYELLAVGLYSLWRLVCMLRAEGAGKATWLALMVAAGVVLGASLSAVQLVPTYDSLRFVERAHRPYEARVERGPAPHVLAMAIVPDVFGNPVESPPWGRHEFGENIPGYYAPSSTYAGVLPLILAVWVLVAKRDGLSVFFVFLAVLSISVFLDTVVFRLLYYIPIFEYGRQVEAKIIYMFAISVLAALGLNSLLEPAREADKRSMRLAAIALVMAVIATLGGLGFGWIFIGARGVDSLGLLGKWYVYNVGHFLRFAVLVFVSSALLLLLSTGRIKPRLFSVLAVGLVVVDLFYFGWRFNPTQDPTDLYPETGGIEFLQADGGIFRIMRGPGGKHTLPPNTPAVYGLSDAGGYRSLLLGFYGDFMNLIEEGVYDPESVQMRSIQSLSQAESLSSKLLDLLNVKYILSRPQGREDLTLFDEADESIELVHQDDMRVYENKDVLPRAFVVGDYKVLPDREEIFAELTSERFDPASCVILDEEPSDDFARHNPGSANSSAQILDYTANRVTIEADVIGDGFLVLSDLYYDGWKVVVDGEEGKVYRADYVLRAVQLGEGRHLVEFIFDPLPFKVGLGVSGVALACTVSLSTWCLVRKRACGGIDL